MVSLAWSLSLACWVCLARRSTITNSSHTCELLLFYSDVTQELVKGEYMVGAPIVLKVRYQHLKTCSRRTSIVFSYLVIKQA